MNLRYALPMYQTKIIILALASFAASPILSLTAQPAQNVAWPSYAEERIKSIYDRGEFRAKVIRPNWLNDSSGFVADEIDPKTKQTTAWHYDVKTGDRRIATNEERSQNSKANGDAVSNSTRIEARGTNLVSINKATNAESVLVTGTPNREIEYHNVKLSPDGTKVLFVESDYTDVKQRSVLVPGDPSYPGVEQHRFARVGGAIEKLRVGFVNVAEAQVNWLKLELPEEGCYLSTVDWAGNSEEILVEKLSRFRNKRDIYLAGINGEVKSIFSETNEAWVESSQGKNTGIIWLQEGKEFIVISEKDGWRHAFRHTRDGKEVTKLTAGDFDIIERGIVDEANNWFYYYASPKDATQKYLYRIRLDGAGTPQPISPQNQIGTHGYAFSPDAKWAVHTFSTLNTPPIHELIEVENHRVIKVLDENSDIRERMKSIGCQPAEFMKLDIGNGIEFDAWMVKPRDFDATKKYPVFVYVYGEPHAQTVLNEWGAAQIDFNRVVAEHGYIVVSIDNRGTPAPKGAAWRRAIFGSLGPLSTEEQEAGLKAIAKQCPFVDTERVGIWGWSGGGSNTLNALFRKPNSYHVGIAVVPKPQPHLYNAWFQEIFMRDREVNPDGYARSAPINFAEGLKGKLLIMTGSGETNTHIQIIEGLVDKLIALGKPFDYMVYPNRDHGLREGEGTQVHVRMHILRYLRNNLAPGPR